MVMLSCMAQPYMTDAQTDTVEDLHSLSLHQKTIILELRPCQGLTILTEILHDMTIAEYLSNPHRSKELRKYAPRMLSHTSSFTEVMNLQMSVDSLTFLMRIASPTMS